MIGKIHSYETFAAADGPGVRFMIFLSGCPFRCRYCHNPDTWASASFDATADEILEKAKRYRAYWGNEGGITASGGEPLLQAEFIAELFSKAHKEKISTCLDTSAACFDEKNEKILRAIDESDTVLLDIKHIDDTKHRDLTGASNSQVLACAKYLARIGKPVWIRHVLVPKITDDKDDLINLGKFIKTLPNVKRVDILPYHKFGIQKWEKLNLPYSLSSTPEPTSEEVSRARELILSQQ